MGGRAPQGDYEEQPGQPFLAPSPLHVLLVALLVFVVLVANGRPIGAGDTRPTERVATSLVQSLDFDLDEFPEVEPPFARQAGPRKASIYPVLSAVLATPVFAACGALFALDETGTALAGKLAAALLSSLAAAVFFVALARYHPLADARAAALLLALGTSVFSTSQALWQHPAAVLFLSLLVYSIFRGFEDDTWAGRAGLPWALALAARHADAVLLLPIAIGIAVRWPRRVPAFLLWAAPVGALLAAYHLFYFGSPLLHGFSGGLLNRFSEPWGRGQLGLLLSPAKGLFVFTPLVLVAVVGLVRQARRDEPWTAATFGTAALAHVVFIGRWSEWHGGESFGPRMLTDVLPLLFVFLPAGFDALPRMAPVLAAFSVGVQLLGAFAYDYRWERLHQRPPAPDHAELWDASKSPIVFYAAQRVALLALPGADEGRAFIREHPVVLFGANGSRVTFRGGAPLVEGSERNFGDVHLQRGARVAEGRLRLRGRFDALFLRVRGAARQRRLELRASGRGSGTLYVGERSFWSSKTRWKEYPISGGFTIRHPYYHPESGGADLLVALGRDAGEAALDSVALVPPNEPDNVIRNP
jgi:hypothetical protein